MPTDRYGIEWDLLPAELCSTCGQPDNCGDCTHGPLSAAEVAQLGGAYLQEGNVMKAHDLTYQPSTSDPVQHLATVFPASTDLVLDVLATPQTKEHEHNGHSEWVWLRLLNGDLVLGIFPQGDVYEMIQDRVEEDYKAALKP